MSPYEGEFLIKGRPYHSSGVPYKYEIYFSVDIKLNCDTVQIVVAPGQLSFDITPPVESVQTPKPWPISNDDLMHWMGESRSYEMHGSYTNPNPYSCTMEHKLGETTDGGSSFDSTRSNSDLFISMDTAGPKPVINVASTAN